MLSYRYRDLDRSSNQIQILRFHYGDNVDTDLIACTLHHVSLDDANDIYEDFLEHRAPSASDWQSNCEAWLRCPLHDEPSA